MAARTATAEARTCAGGCGALLSPTEIKHGYRTKRGHTPACPSPRKAQQVEVAAETTGETVDLLIDELPARHADVLRALKSMHIVPEMTVPAFAGGEGYHVRLEASHMTEENLNALRAYLGNKE